MSDERSTSFSLPILLSATHVLLFLVTMFSTGKTASDGNPLFCADLPVSLPLAAKGDNWTMMAIGILGTGWWYFIGQIGRAASMQKILRPRAGLGALLLLCVCAGVAYGMISEFVSMAQNGSHFVMLDYVIYAFVFVLLAGGFASAGLCAMAALGFTTSNS